VTVAYPTSGAPEVGRIFSKKRESVVSEEASGHRFHRGAIGMKRIDSRSFRTFSLQRASLLGALSTLLLAGYGCHSNPNSHLGSGVARTDSKRTVVATRDAKLAPSTDPAGTRPSAAPADNDDRLQSATPPAENEAKPSPTQAEPKEDVQVADELMAVEAAPAVPTRHKSGSVPLRLSGVGSGGGGVAYGMALGRRAASASHGSLAVSAPAHEGNAEAYAHVPDAQFLSVKDQPLSTFAADVDTASYANVRRFLNSGSMPPKDAVRAEELINYFSYDYPAPAVGQPFSVHTEVASAPWAPKHRLVQIGVRTPELKGESVAKNLVFLIDVSGSMASPDKLPLLKRGMELLVDTLSPQDRVAIVVYAGNSGVVLPATSGASKDVIRGALAQLEAGGSTNGGEGIEMAYRLSEQNFIKGGVNRVVLATDGDFNVGTTSEGELTRLIEKKRKSGVFLTVLGFGQGNVKDSTMEMLANKGNGNYAYIDDLAEARKVLVREGGATLNTVAKDVKFQVEFNPALVASYRLIGYENRTLAARDFNDDKKDAGEMGAGHTVTALYEVVPVGQPTVKAQVDPLKYQSPQTIVTTTKQNPGELLTLKIRYKKPSAETSEKITVTTQDSIASFEAASTDFRFSAAVAAFSMVLSGSAQRGSSSLALVERLAKGALGNDVHGDRKGFLGMVRKAETFSRPLVSQVLKPN